MALLLAKGFEPFKLGVGKQDSDFCQEFFSRDVVLAEECAVVNITAHIYSVVRITRHFSPLCHYSEYKANILRTRQA